MPPALQNPFVLWFVLTAALAGLAYAFLRKELVWRGTLYGSFLIACGVAFWPPEERIKLGLDLKGTVLLALTLIVATLSLGTGRTTVLQGVVHLVIFAVYLFTAIVP